ncbi:hypothetical protein AA101099_2577 [Neoasaia chiangmaiensis NBRC 101099]|nr:hypothetical protein AA101099_2577 [Neoasaia chiangmaiensis NBRC 101099]GEN14346.1 hypothetical protein NCH01_07770 [Neoasaia chiangmaiensis]
MPVASRRGSAGPVPALTFMARENHMTPIARLAAALTMLLAVSACSDTSPFRDRYAAPGSSANQGPSMHGAYAQGGPGGAM